MVQNYCLLGDTMKNNTQFEENYDEIDDYLPTKFDAFCAFINRQHWLALVLFLAGLISFFFFNKIIALYLVAAALIIAGSIPVITGTYRSPALGFLYGTKARIRGLFSLTLGIIVLVFTLTNF